MSLSLENIEPTPLKRIPERKGFPILGHAVPILQDPLKFLIGLKREGEPIVKINLGSRTYVVIQDLKIAEHILLDKSNNYPKPGAAKRMKQFLGEGLATSNGDFWLKQRRIMQPAFHKDRVNSFKKIIDQEVNWLIKKWETQSFPMETKINEDFFALTLKNITRTMFGAEIENLLDQLSKIVTNLLDSASNSVTSLINLPLAFPTPSNQKFKKAKKEFDQIVYGIIDKRILEGGNQENPDLLDMLIKSFEEISSPTTKENLRDEVATIFMTGHETTAQTLSWIFYHLAKDPKLLQRVREEGLQTSKEAENLTHASSGFLQALIYETLRMYPPVWIMARKSKKEDRLESYHLPANATILINIYGINHDPKTWKDPEKFDPERFLGSILASHPFQFIPFGAGKRACIGNSLAMIVMKTVIIRLIQKYDFSLPPSNPVSIEPSITLRAKGGIKVIVNPKHNLP